MAEATAAVGSYVVWGALCFGNWSFSCLNFGVYTLALLLRARAFPCEALTSVRSDSAHHSLATPPSPPPLFVCFSKYNKMGHGNAKDDVQRYLDDYPDQVDDPAQSVNLEVCGY